MDLDLIKKGLDLTARKKKWILILGAFGFTTYGAYKIYSSPSFAKKRERLLKLFGALFAVAEVVYDSSEAIGILCKDLKVFLASDCDSIPQSLKQVSKITISDELTESLTHVTRAVTVGILRGYLQETAKNPNSFVRDSSFSDRVLDRLFSDAGSGFASVVVGSFTRNLIMAFYSNYDHYRTPKSDQSVTPWFEVACEYKYRELIGEFIRVFVSTAVTVYLDKTMNINTYDEMFSGLTNPKHEGRVRDLLVSVCNGAVDTYIKTTNQIASSNLCSHNPRIGYEDGFGGDNIAAKWISATLGSKKLRDKIIFNQEKGWITRISSAFAVPRNRKFVLDITGTVTFESVRSFLEFVVQKLSDCVKRSVDLVQHEVIDRGAEAIMFASSKSSVVITVCITLCLHILNGPWVFTYYA